jgi:hypothetical protein
MRGKFPDDTFTEADVLSYLESAGLKYKNGHRYILSQCPIHEDENPSVQIYKDDWFVNCHAGCGRYHITKAFPQLRPNNSGYTPSPMATRKEPKMTQQHQYKQFDQMEYWKSLPLIPRDHQFKTIPLETLDFMGWRWVPDKNSYFIPYFNMTETQIPFSQLRHLQGDRRFTFLKDARPIIYGLQNLDPNNGPLFLVEGSSDCAVLEHCAMSWLGTPSASQKELIHGLGRYCKENGIQLVYAGDNDTAGDKVREALDDVVAYRVHQPPKKYKDWGDFLVAEGYDVVYQYLWDFIQPPVLNVPIKQITDLESIQNVFPGSVELKVVGHGESKEQSVGGQQPLL